MTTSTPTTKPPQGKTAVRTLILGVFAIIWSLVPVLGFIGFLAGIAALILGSIRLKKEGTSSYTVTGMVLGAVAIVLFIIASIFYLLLVMNSIDKSLQAN